MTMPFDGEEFTFTNPDGTEIKVRGWGDQYYAVFETLDGFTVMKDPETGFFVYADLSEDKNSLIPTNTKVGEADPISLGLRPHVRIRRESEKTMALEAHEMERRPSRWEVRRAAKKTQAISPLWAAATEAAPLPGAKVGDYVGLCLLIDFPDVSGTISRAEVENFCNQAGYSGYGNNGSVHDYFDEVSGGRMNYTNVVTAYYTAANNRSYYTDPAISYGTRARQLIVEALDSLVASGFDFDQLSSDGGGFVYALNVFYAGARVNNWSEGLWPHAWVLASDYVAAPGKKFRDYQITNMGDELTLRTFCHENGHMVCDFPDLYDYGSESFGVGHYCLMCYGGNNKNPVHVCAYLKNEAGWTNSITPITPGITGSVSAGMNDFYIYTKSASEYFIIENRQQQGRDVFLPDSGLAIWHVDEFGSNNNEQMTAGQHYECSLEQADNAFDLENKSNAGDSEDLFSAPYNLRFADDTSPNSRWWDGSPSGLLINQISSSGPTMTFVTSDVSQINSRVLELLLLEEEDITAPVNLLLG